MRPYSGLSLESCRGEINFSFSNLFAFFGMTTKPSLVEFVSDASFFGGGNSAKWPFSFRAFLDLFYLAF